MSEVKKARTDHPVHELISNRWSPYSFDPRPVSDEDLLAVFEAARWAPSSYNEQPWRYIVASRQDSDAFERMLSCLVEGNQAWAKNVSALALGVVSLTFARNGSPNRVAPHDLGLASALLTIEATSRGLFVHQMGGIVPKRAMELYDIPDGFEVATALAIGYAGATTGELGERDLKPRSRRPLSETVFSGRFGTPFKEPG